MQNRVSVPVYRTVSLAYDQLQTVYKGNLHDQILPQLFLGSIPTTETPFGESFANTSQKLIDFVNKKNPAAPLKLVVSVVEPDEIKGDGFYGSKMVQPEEWKKQNVETTLLNMVDCTAVVNNKEAIETILKMRNCITAGGSVYVHCKAGRGRSAMICAAYLAAYEINPETGKYFTVNEAHSFLKKARSQVNLEADKLAKANELVNILNPKTESTAIATEKKEDAENQKPSYHSSVANFWNKNNYNKAIVVASAVTASAVLASTIMRLGK